MRSLSGAMRLRVATLAVALFVAVTAAGCSASITIGATDAPTQVPGNITFGTSLDSKTWVVSGASTTFKTTDTIGWAARLTDSAKSSTLTLTLATVDSSGTETVVDTETVNVTDQTDDIFGHIPDTALGALGAGTYKMRYTRPSDGTVLATGTVTITA
ncbi:MAG TPA: hypothetical protein VF337_06230 [Candidatus Limnocylindrales bacterium]